MPTAPAVRPAVSIVPAARAQAALAHPQAVLTAAELDVYSRFGSDKRRVDFLSGRLAAKEAVRSWCEASGKPAPKSIEVLNGQEGEPSVSGMPEVYISIAHGALGGYAAAHAAPVGVDAEVVAYRPPEVLAYFVRSDEEARGEREATALWTVKEAVLKMLQLGFAGGLQNVRWDRGRRCALFGAAEHRQADLGIARFAVEQRFEGNTSYCLAYAETIS